MDVFEPKDPEDIIIVLGKSIKYKDIITAVNLHEKTKDRVKRSMEKKRKAKKK